MALARQLINAPHAVVVRAAAPPAPRVALLSGGGSGHEPLHTGFVGPGMLDAAVPGAVFASPNPAQIHAATAAVDQGRGVVHLVKNYTGDVLNFAIAAELAAADGIEVETVLVDDDLATDGGDVDGPGRRGTAAVIAVEKICGAAAEAGVDLIDVARLGRRVVSGAATLAVALSGCTHPGRREASFVLADDEVELGVGIHGERGTRRSPLSPVAELVAQLVDPVVAALGLETGEEVLAIVNGLGSTGYLELAVVFREVAQALDEREIAIARSLVGTYVTSLDMVSMVLDLASAGVWVERFVADVDRSADDLGELDRLSGDGDFGVNVRAALHRARDTLRGGDQSRVGDVFAALASSFLAAGGTSGPLFGTWFGALSRATASPTIGLVDAAQREVAMDLGVAQAAAAAREGAAATARLIARRGRASYLGETAARVADPGAVTVALFFEAGAVAVGVGAP